MSRTFYNTGSSSTFKNSSGVNWASNLETLIRLTQRNLTGKENK